MKLGKMVVALLWTMYVQRCSGTLRRLRCLKIVTGSDERVLRLPYPIMFFKCHALPDALCCIQHIIFLEVMKLSGKQWQCCFLALLSVPIYWRTCLISRRAFRVKVFSAILEAVDAEMQEKRLVTSDLKVQFLIEHNLPSIEIKGSAVLVKFYSWNVLKHACGVCCSIVSCGDFQPYWMRSELAR